MENIEVNNQNKKSKTIKWSLIIGIVIVLNLFFNYSLSLIYSAPEYERFCPTKQVREAITDQAQCLAVGGSWNENTYAPLPGEKSVPKGYCDEYFTCSKNYQEAQKEYEKNVFITLVVLGVLSIVAGVFIKGVEVLSLSLSIGGVLSFVVASIRFWSLADQLLKVVILAIALASLIYLAIKKFKD